MTCQIPLKRKGSYRMTTVKRITWEDICKKVDCEKPSKNGIKIKQNALSEVQCH